MSSHISSEYRVQRLTPDHIETTHNLLHRIIMGSKYYNDKAKSSEVLLYTVDCLTQMINDEPDSILIALHNEDCIGFCISEKDVDLLWLSWIGTHDNYRSMGVARSLLNFLNDIMIAKGVHKIWCDCLAINKESRSLLQKEGYKEICIIDNHWYGQDFVLLQKFIISNVP